jgi:hypothetical protein
VLLIKHVILGLQSKMTLMYPGSQVNCGNALWHQIARYLRATGPWGKSDLLEIKPKEMHYLHFVAFLKPLSDIFKPLTLIT